MDTLIEIFFGVNHNTKKSKITKYIVVDYISYQRKVCDQADTHTQETYKGIVQTGRRKFKNIMF